MSKFVRIGLFASVALVAFVAVGCSGDNPGDPPKASAAELERQKNEAQTTTSQPGAGPASGQDHATIGAKPRR